MLELVSNLLDILIAILVFFSEEIHCILFQRCSLLFWTSEKQRQQLAKKDKLTDIYSATDSIVSPREINML